MKLFPTFLLSIQVVLIVVSANEIAKASMIPLHLLLIGTNTFFGLLNLKAILS